MLTIPGSKSCTRNNENVPFPGFFIQLVLFFEGFIITTQINVMYTRFQGQPAPFCNSDSTEVQK